MASIFQRGGKLYAKIQDVLGVWRQVATGFDADQRAHAERWVAERVAKVERERQARGGGTGLLTVRAYGEAWLKKRTTATVGDDRSRLRLHAFPVIGELLLTEVRPRHMRDLILKLRADGELAPKTIREVSGVCHTMFKSAKIEDLIVSNPVEYERGVLPKKVDKDPTWRHEAIFERAEIEQLLTDERLPQDRRVLYALKFFTGRHTEVATMKWSQYDASAKPLGRINLGKTKSGVPRAVPVHPALAAMLATWKLSGWEATYKRKPKPEDMIVTTRAGKRRKASESQKQFVRDLARIGLRTKAGQKQNRRGHDLRRTLISLCREDGAIDSILRLITHGPKPGEILDVYSTQPWHVLCTELAKLMVSLKRGSLVQLVAVAQDGT